MSGGRDGSVLTLICPQTSDLAGDRGIGRGDIVRLGIGSDGGASYPWRDVDPIFGRSIEWFGGAAVPVGK